MPQSTQGRVRPRQCLGFDCIANSGGIKARLRCTGVFIWAYAGKNVRLHARMLVFRAGSLGVGGCAAAQTIGPSENKLRARVLGWVSGVCCLITGYPPSPTPSIFRIMGLGMVWLAKSRCQRTCRSKSRKQGSYGRSLARLLRVSPSRWRCYCWDNYERNPKRAQGQMSQGGCGNFLVRF